MSQGVLIAEEQTILRTSDSALAGTLSDVKVKSKLSRLAYRIIKRSFDLVFGLIGCLMTPPLPFLLNLLTS